MVYHVPGVKGKTLTGEAQRMDALEMTLLFDYYGELLTERQRMCFDLYHNQDLSLAEIAQELQVSRQGVYDNLSRAEATLRNMEEKTGCVRRNLLNRRALRTIQEAASQLQSHSDPQVRELSQQIMTAAGGFEE
jgi:predicted DNA-binding protein YlxM (UPF0122 family)